MRPPPPRQWLLTELPAEAFEEQLDDSCHLGTCNQMLAVNRQRSPQWSALLPKPAPRPSTPRRQSRRHKRRGSCCLSLRRISCLAHRLKDSGNSKSPASKAMITSSLEGSPTKMELPHSDPRFTNALQSSKRPKTLGGGKEVALDVSDHDPVPGSRSLPDVPLDCPLKHLRILKKLAHLLANLPSRGHRTGARRGRSRSRRSGLNGGWHLNPAVFTGTFKLKRSALKLRNQGTKFSNPCPKRIHFPTGGALRTHAHVKEDETAPQSQNI